MVTQEYAVTSAGAQALLHNTTEAGSKRGIPVGIEMNLHQVWSSGLRLRDLHTSLSLGPLPILPHCEMAIPP